MNKLLIAFAIIVVVSGCGREHEQTGNVAIVDKSEVGGNKEIIHISSFEELCIIGEHPAFPLNGHYELTADIDASQSQGMNGGQGFKPIGKFFRDRNYFLVRDSIFTGVFDGKGYIITGLFINRPNDTAAVGLFGVVYGPDAEIRNLRVVSATVIGNECVGGIVGRTNEGVNITQCYFRGTIRGTGSYVGGLAGFTGKYLIITSSCFIGNVNGISYSIGGLVGCAADKITISKSYSIGDVIGRNNGAERWVIGVGGLIGSTSDSATISQCYSTGNVIGQADVGGLVGIVDGRITITRSYSTGNVTGEKGVGGLVGSTLGNPVAAIIQCYFAGSVTGKNNAGGLVGFHPKASFWEVITGDVTGELPPPFRIKSSYWDVASSGISCAKDRSGRTTAQMMRRGTYRGWDFRNVWQIDEGKSYPRLRALESE